MTIYIKKSTDGGSPPVITQAAGSIIALLDFLLVTTTGWTKEFSGTNLACYRAPVGTNRFRLYVDDTSTTTARLIGYEEMTSISAGTGLFPTTAQLSGGLYLAKTAAAAWKFFSNGRIFHLASKPSTAWNVHSFGDFLSDKAADAFNTIHIGQHSTGVTNSNFAILTAAMVTVTNGHYIARPHDQTGSSLAVGKFSDTVRSNGATVMSNGGSTYPNPIGGALQMAPVWISDAIAANGARGLLPGVWNPLHPYPLADGDTFSGTGNLTGRTFEAVCVQGAGSHQCFIETSDTWGGI